MASLTENLAALATMSPAQLRAEWRRVYRTSPPRLTPDLLIRGIAYRLQERAHGGLPPATARQLDRMAQRLLRGDGPANKPELRLKPGTRLVRSWNGTTYSVLVTNDGFAMGDRNFTSLSHVAEVITGAHWSGPRFFGIKAGRATIGAAAASASRREAAAAIAAAAQVAAVAS
jgi:hypothetical protein